MRRSSFQNSRRSFGGASRLRAENRLGLPRPSFDDMRTTTNRGNGSNRKSGQEQQSNNPQSEVETDYDDYYDDDYVDEQEAEALLSKLHGEASEAGGDDSDSKKRPNKEITAQDILDEYKNQEKELKKKTRLRVQRTVTPEHLLKSNGLTVVRNKFCTDFHDSTTNNNSNANSKPKYSNTTRSMARYSRKLVSAYSNWVETMTNGIPLLEAQWKLRTLGSKTQVKQYLQDMQKTVRDDHVERVLGLEKAERLLTQLADYELEAQREDEEEYPAAYDDEENDAAGGMDSEEAQENVNTSSSTTDPSSPSVVNPYNTRAADSNTVTPAKPETSDPNQENDNIDDDNKDKNNADQEEEESARGKQQKSEEDPLLRNLRLQKELRARRQALEDSDDEEAVFGFDNDDDAPKHTSNDEGSSSPQDSPAAAPKKKYVLDDDDDDDDE